MEIRDLGKPIPDPEVIKHWIPDTDPQHCYKSSANQVMNCLPTVAGGAGGDPVRQDVLPEGGDVRLLAAAAARARSEGSVRLNQLLLLNNIRE
jgi:hypothetical protein